MILETKGGIPDYDDYDRIVSIACATVPVTSSPTNSPSGIPAPPTVRPTRGPALPTFSPTGGSSNPSPTSGEDSEMSLFVIVGLVGVGSAVLSFAWFVVVRTRPKKDGETYKEKKQKWVGRDDQRPRDRESSRSNRGSSKHKRERKSQELPQNVEAAFKQEDSLRVLCCIDSSSLVLHSLLHLIVPFLLSNTPSPMRASFFFIFNLCWPKYRAVLFFLFIYNYFWSTPELGWFPHSIRRVFWKEPFP
jgi:hypothetical protein